jgi:hypothetical protein
LRWQQDDGVRMMSRYCSTESATPRVARLSFKIIWRALGPGVITGAADDDPSGIATYSQAGAQFGFALTWTMFLTAALHGGHSDHQRLDRLADGERARAQHRAAAAEAGALSSGRAARHRQHHQHRGRSRGDGRIVLK